MARKVVYECDLTKREYDPDETVTITIKRGGKVGRKYEISDEAAKLLEGQLTAGERLPEGWAFISEPLFTPASAALEAGRGASASARRLHLAEQADDAENRDEDDALARKIKADHKERLEEESPPEEEEEEKGPVDQNDCPHMNRTRVQMTENSAYVNCKDCGAKLPLKKTSERDAEASAGAPRGSREGYHAKKR